MARHGQRRVPLKHEMTAMIFGAVSSPCSAQVVKNLSQHCRSFHTFAGLPVHRHTSSTTSPFDTRCYPCGQTGAISPATATCGGPTNNANETTSHSPPLPGHRGPNGGHLPLPHTVNQLSHDNQRTQLPAPIREDAAEIKLSDECEHDVAGGVCVAWHELMDDKSLSPFDCPHPESPPKGDSFSDTLVLALLFWREIGAN